MIEGAKIINKTLKYVDTSLTVAAVIIDSYHIGCAFKDNLYIRDNAKKNNIGLEETIEKLKKTLKIETDSSKRQEIRNAIKHIKEILKDVKCTRKVPVKTVSITGDWLVSVICGFGGIWIGTERAL